MLKCGPPAVTVLVARCPCFGTPWPWFRRVRPCLGRAVVVLCPVPWLHPRHANSILVRHLLACSPPVSASIRPQWNMHVIIGSPHPALRHRTTWPRPTHNRPMGRGIRVMRHPFLGGLANGHVHRKAMGHCTGHATFQRAYDMAWAMGCALGPYVMPHAPDVADPLVHGPDLLSYEVHVQGRNATASPMCLCRMACPVCGMSCGPLRALWPTSMGRPYLPCLERHARISPHKPPLGVTVCVTPTLAKASLHLPVGAVDICCGGAFSGGGAHAFQKASLITIRLRRHALANGHRSA